MPITVAQLAVRVAADGVEEAGGKLKGFSSEVDSARGHHDDFMKHLLQTTGVLAAFEVAKKGVELVGDQLSEAVRAGMEANKVDAQLAAVIKSTGDASGYTAEQAGKLAEAFMRKTGIDESGIKSNEAMLMTFTNIGRDTFPQATQAVLDMSTALGENGKDAAIQLGKALNDPVNGITALHRVGVEFSGQQKQQIKLFMQHGDVAKAQGVILGELSKEFGGSAEAAGHANGGLSLLTAQFHSLQEKVGQAAIPVIGQLVTAIQPMVSAFADWLPGAIKQVQPFLHDVVQNGIQLVEGAIKSALPTVHTLGDWFMTKILPALQTVGKFIFSDLVPTFVKLEMLWVQSILPVLRVLAEVIFNQVLPALMSVWGHIERSLIPSIQKLWEKISPILIPALQLVGGVIQNVVGPALGMGIDLVGKLVDAVTAIITKIGDFLGVLGHVKDAIGGAFGDVGKLLGSLGSLHLPGFAGGTDNAPGGLAIVGEHGPELVNLPSGSQVIPLPYSQSYSGGGGGSPTLASTFIIQLDGRTIAQGTATHLPGIIRLATGIKI
jgi:phage-related protein